jgi:hypothetical protein
MRGTRAARPALSAIVLFAMAAATYAAEWSDGLKADYGFTPRHIGHADVGLAPGEVWMVKFSTVWEGRPESEHPFDEYLLKFAIQGLLNRHGPLYWNDTIGFGWGQYVQLWRDYFASTRGLVFREMGPEIGPIVERLAPVFNGVIVYDMQPSDKMFLAANLANLNACLPVSKRIYDEHRAAFEGVPVVADLTGRECTRGQIYDWLIAEVLPRTNRTVAYNACMSFADLRTAPQAPNLIQGMDYPFYKKGFLFNLPAAEYPIGRPSTPGLVIDGSPEIARAFDGVMRGLIVPATIYGWGDPEDHWIPRMSAYGHAMRNTANSPNLSFVAGIPPLEPPPYVQDTAPRIDKPEAKVYITFMANEGDTAISLWDRYFGAWDKPSRGTAPINWGVNPANVEEFPSLFEYFFRTRTPNDYFVLAASGSGYITPRTSRDLAPFLRLTDRGQAFINCRELDVWGASRESMDQYADQLPWLRAITVLPEVMPAGAPNVFTVGRTHKVPLIRRRPEEMYWNNGPLLTMDEKGWEGFHVQMDLFLRHLQWVYDSGPAVDGKPGFVTIYGVMGTIPDEIARIQAELDPSRYEIISYATMAHLAAQTNAPEPTPTPAPEAKVLWSDELLRRVDAWEATNDATLSATADGLAVQVGEGRDWGVARLVDCKLPEGSAGVTIRVREISPGATWVVKMAADYYGLGTVTDYLPFTEGAGTGERHGTFPAPFRDRARQPLHNLQLGVVGPAGSRVVIEALTFTPDSTER